MSSDLSAEITAIATAVLAAFAILTAVVASLAFWKQSKAVEDGRELIGKQGDLLKIQSGQLDEQRKINTEQIKVLGLQALTFERQQAEGINLRLSGHVMPADGESADPPRLYAAEVTNDSRRPVRNAACRIEPEPGDSLQEAKRVGIMAEPGMSEGTHIPFIRVRATGIFVFAVEVAEHLKPRMTARFTDDVGLHWQISPDLELKKLGSRDDW
jgi:hypothetical protein